MRQNHLQAVSEELTLFCKSVGDADVSFRPINFANSRMLKGFGRAHANAFGLARARLGISAASIEPHTLEPREKFLIHN